MEKIKKMLLLGIPMSICNFRCHYCYLAQRDECYQGIQPEMKYSPKEVAYALRPERLGGLAFINICADGETLLVKDIDIYVKELIKQGHYVELVTNCTITPVLNKFLEWDPELLSHLEFKCSFHYLELKKRDLLDVFSNNVNRIWRAGASASVEMVPSDEVIPFIDEIKKFSLDNFRAMPHLTIARNDRTESIDYLTNLPIEEYDRIWSSFESDFWAFKKSIFGIKQQRFCYAGAWSAYINLQTGEACACYCAPHLGNVFSDPNAAWPEKPIGKCPYAHCYNGHAFLTLGLIPHITNVRYGDIRNRVCKDGFEWLQPNLKAFFNTTLVKSNHKWSYFKEWMVVNHVKERVYAWLKGKKQKR